ncbi:MAG: hypothetical protein OS130_11830 [Thermodesulfobacteriota bacterium]|nr:MAG: hypothetical protein OS130_11830 [Thermodesulfobacteriota bacterium]
MSKFAGKLATYLMMGRRSFGQNLMTINKGEQSDWSSEIPCESF